MSARKPGPLDGPVPVIMIFAVLALGCLLSLVMTHHSAEYTQCTVNGGHVVTHGSTNVCLQDGQTIETWKE